MNKDEVILNGRYGIQGTVIISNGNITITKDSVLTVYSGEEDDLEDKSD